MTAFPLPRNILRMWLIGLSLLVLVGLVAGLAVLGQGLGLTNLTDLVPWGLWITIDLSSIALSAGAFSLCALVYLLGVDKLKPLARTATYIGLIGYTMAVLTLLIDIGRPDRFWHPVVFWNPHSVLWEVTMCVMLYSAVLALETAPLFSQLPQIKHRWPGLADWLNSLHHLAPYLAIAGLGLSMLHQSSLGAAYGVLKARPVWYRPGISVLFIVSAVAGGMALTGLASSISAKLSRRASVDETRIEFLGRLAGWVLLALLYLRFWDVLAMTYTGQPGRDEGLALLTSGPLALNFWLFEVLLGMLVPAIILLRADWRRRIDLRNLAFAFIVVGVIAYRWDTTMVGQWVVLSFLPNQISASYARYTPALVEWAVGVGVAAFGLLAFTLGVRHLNVIDHRLEQQDSTSKRGWQLAPAGD